MENKVGYVRYNFFTPSPVIQDLTHLRELLFEKCKEDHQRFHYKKGVVIADLLEEEKKYGLALPEADYPVFKQSMVTANKYGEVQIDGALVHVPQSYHYSKLHLIQYWDHYKVVSPNGELLCKEPRPYMNQARNSLAIHITKLETQATFHCVFQVLSLPAWKNSSLLKYRIHEIKKRACRVVIKLNDQS